MLVGFQTYHAHDADYLRKFLKAARNPDKEVAWQTLLAYCAEAGSSKEPEHLEFAKGLLGIWEERARRIMEHHCSNPGGAGSYIPQMVSYSFMNISLCPPGWKEEVGMTPKLLPANQLVDHLLKRAAKHMGEAPTLALARPVLTGAYSIQYGYCLGCGANLAMNIGFQSMGNSLGARNAMLFFDTSQEATRANMVSWGHMSMRQATMAAICSTCNKQCQDCGESLTSEWDPMMLKEFSDTGMCPTCGKDRLEHVQPPQMTKPVLYNLRQRFTNLPERRPR